MKPEVGQSLGHRYTLLTSIATGGMGDVWVAQDLLLGRDVAVKVLKEQYSGDAGFLARFRIEARNTAALTHEGIASLLDYGEENGSGFLVMELVPGLPLSEILERDTTVAPGHTLRILAATARAIHAAHVAGMVHRDVKPGNILIEPDGRVKITDFGISKLGGSASITEEGMVMGTAQYLSPEQASGHPAGPASDIYALGIVGYEMLVGYRPFTGATALDIALAHVDTPVPPLPGEVPKDVADIIYSMLAKDPAKRPRSAASLARTMEALAVKYPVEKPLPAYGPWQDDLKALDRAPVIAAAAKKNGVVTNAKETFTTSAQPPARPAAAPAPVKPPAPKPAPELRRRWMGWSTPPAARPKPPPIRPVTNPQAWGHMWILLALAVVVLVVSAVVGGLLAAKLWAPSTSSEQHTAVPAAELFWNIPTPGHPGVLNNAKE